MPKLKVYGTTASIRGTLTPETLGDALHIRQCRAVVATTSKKAAAELLGMNIRTFNYNGCETGNPEEIAMATAEPGTPLYTSMNGRGRGWFHADGTPAGH